MADPESDNKLNDGAAGMHASSLPEWSMCQLGVLPVGTSLVRCSEIPADSSGGGVACAVPVLVPCAAIAVCHLAEGLQKRDETRECAAADVAGCGGAPTPPRRAAASVRVHWVGRTARDGWSRCKGTESPLCVVDACSACDFAIAPPALCSSLSPFPPLLAAPPPQIV